jgi:hypothetical protein
MCSACSLFLLLLLNSNSAHCDEPFTSESIANLIDRRLEQLCLENNQPAWGIVDDATFLRRASLDLIGRIPTVSEVNVFLADTDPRKRVNLIQSLTDSGAHTRHMATFWRRSWIPQADTPEYVRLAAESEAWIARRLQDKVPYDKIASEVIVSVAAESRKQRESSIGFEDASDGKPENLAANATRAFLGVNLDCAQCHDHPFARWSRDQFWQTAAFFVARNVTNESMTAIPELMIPETDRRVSAKLLDDKLPSWPDSGNPRSGREVFARWMTTNDNPYFARNAVNRIWSLFYGAALVEPLDDLSNPIHEDTPQDKLLWELSRRFVDSGYDLQLLVRGMTSSKFYSRSSVTAKVESESIPTLLMMPVRGLTGEQLYNSLRTAAGLPLERQDIGFERELSTRNRFIAQFYVPRPIAAERSISQSLSMMNATLIQEMTTTEHNQTLRGIIDAPFLDTEAQVNTLYVAALGRQPSSLEHNHIKSYLARVSDKPQAFGDLFWVLINSTEFNTNH